MGAASAAAVFVCSILTSYPGGVRRAIGVHIGLILPIVFTGVFMWRGQKAFADPKKQYLGYLLAVMAIGSLFALVGLLANKPPSPRKAKSAE
eukprot:m.100424 g.100424  ORF g.100424 m.100424 type:complete len:92 (+) comp8928_c0_seq2:1497-1772(+)